MAYSEPAAAPPVAEIASALVQPFGRRVRRLRDPVHTNIRSIGSAQNGLLG
jgi:hypothetical protein